LKSSGGRKSTPLTFRKFGGKKIYTPDFPQNSEEWAFIVKPQEFLRFTMVCYLPNAHKKAIAPEAAIALFKNMIYERY